jgi:hypothetical protein
MAAEPSNTGSFDGVKQKTVELMGSTPSRPPQQEHRDQQRRSNSRVRDGGHPIRAGELVAVPEDAVLAINHAFGIEIAIRPEQTASKGVRAVIHTRKQP